VEWIAEEEGAVIHIPFGVYGMPVVWQTVHGQPLFGGMGENASILWPSGYSQRLRNRFIQRLVVASRAPGYPKGSMVEPEGRDRAHREAILAEGYRWVVLDRTLAVAEVGRMRSRLGLVDLSVEEVADEVLVGLVEVLGEPVAIEDELVTWHLGGEIETPADLQVSEAALNGHAWILGTPLQPRSSPQTPGGRPSAPTTLSVGGKQ